MIPVAIRVAGSIDKYGYWRCILLALLIMPIPGGAGGVQRRPGDDGPGANSWRIRRQGFWGGGAQLYRLAAARQRAR